MTHGRSTGVSSLRRQKNTDLDPPAASLTGNINNRPLKNARAHKIMLNASINVYGYSSAAVCVMRSKSFYNIHDFACLTRIFH